MKIVYSWLKDFIDIAIPAEEMAEALTLNGLEVTSIERRTIPAGIVVGRVIEKKPHPDADRLSVCTVDAGSSEPLTIVCGAPNVAAGMHVPLATIGTVFSPEFTIKKTKLRGIESFGMLCSEKELGISNEHSGLMALPETTIPGKPFSEYYPDDVIFEIELTPDRGDCLSLIGVAREMAARFGLPLKNTALSPREKENNSEVTVGISVRIDAIERCPRYTGRLVRAVTIAPSPQWLQNRLSLAGIRPINNVVDITNYILLHFGQPMHAFDYHQIKKQIIIVKTAGMDQKFTTLDGIERELIADDLLICDGERPVALAGIMGGAGSEITDQTTDVFLECAYFEQIGIRRTSKRLGLSTDSSYRFERGVDPDAGLIAAIDTAAALLATIAGGTVVNGRIDAYPASLQRRIITLRPDKVARVLGITISGEQIRSHLESLQIECTSNHDGTFTCTVPLFRHDLTIEEDLIEEIGRLFGYDNIPTADILQLSLYRTLPTTEVITDTIRHAMAFSGMHETVTNSMIAEKRCRLVTPEKKPIFLLNPLTPDMACMRTSLLSSLLEVTVYNRNRKNFNNRFFEIGKRFEEFPSGRYNEETVLAILLEGNFRNTTWNTHEEPVSFYTMKGIIEAFSSHLGITDPVFSISVNMPPMYANEAATVYLGKNIHGFAGMITPDILEAFDLNTPVCYAELNITEFLTAPLPLHTYKPLPRFPALERDFSFVMDESLSTSTIAATIQSLSPLIEYINPFDIYRGEKIGTGRKSVTFSLRFRSVEKTLTEKDVEPICEKIISTVGEQHNAVLRT